MLLGALEAGGTKMVCAIGDENLRLLEKISIPTTDPETTMAEIIRFYKDKKIAALGVGAFGPIDLKESSESYGSILDSPKLLWRHYPLRRRLVESLGIPIGIDTDVNAACLGEVTKGCAGGHDPVVYITIGTGIGAGLYVNGRLLHGMLHPEAGHIYLKKHPEDHYNGNCHYHKNCFESLAAGTAIQKRWGRSAVELDGCKEVWELESYYIAQALVDYIMILSPEIIILGGGVMNQRQLFPLIREKVNELMGDYLNTRQLANLDQYIVPASLQGDQGIVGCLQLAKQCLEK